MLCDLDHNVIISIHALREEGDAVPKKITPQGGGFLSTPSARRATAVLRGQGNDHRISIHALREEGDCPPESGRYPADNFYPRPPRGGRPYALPSLYSTALFLSTPSARRATFRDQGCFSPAKIFIHALREEGDAIVRSCASFLPYFYPRPPRGGRPMAIAWLDNERGISIHALREEGDRSWF